LSNTNWQNDFAKISRNITKHFSNFTKHFSYFAKFCSIISFAKDISRNFVKYLFREIILMKFREISRITFRISRNFVLFLVSRKKFREISSNIYFAKWFCRNFAKYFAYFAKFRRKTSFAKRYFAKFCFPKSREILRVYFINFAKLRNENFAKFRETKFREFLWPP